jgi:hypothetical protein
MLDRGAAAVFGCGRKSNGDCNRKKNNAILLDEW